MKDKQEERAYFLRQLASLLDKDKPLKDALTRLRAECSESMQHEIDSLMADYRGGEKLGKLLADRPALAVPQLAHLVTAAEEHGGKASTVISGYATTIRRMSEGIGVVRQTLNGYGIYLLFLVVLVLFTLFLVSNFIIGPLTEILGEEQLAAPARALLYLASHNILLWGALAVVVILAVGLYMSIHTLDYDEGEPGLFIRLLPLLGGLFGFYRIVRWLHFTRLLHESGVGAEKALTEALRITGADRAPRQYYQSVSSALGSSQRLKTFTDELVYQEERIDQVFVERSVAVSKASAILAYLVIGLIVGSLVIGVYMPIFQLGSVV